MLVARFWATARAEGLRANGRRTGLQRFGWSNVSQDEAEAHARLRAEEAMARRLAGADEPHRERSLPYAAFEGQPIREEILLEQPCGVLTRNCYGAVCLNTEDGLFVDVDWDRPNKLGCALVAFNAVVAAVALLVLGAQGVLVAGGVAAASVLAHRIEERRRRAPVGPASPDWPPLAALRAWCAGHPTWRVRVYRTPNGLRLLVMHAPLAPRSPEALEFMRAMNADRRYVTMCRLQSCSRARLTPKSWRIDGGPSRLRPRSGRWPLVDVAARAERDAWVAAYDAARVGYAACRFVLEVGAGSTHPQVEAVRALHDQWCDATADLPLA